MKTTRVLAGLVVAVLAGIGRADAFDAVRGRVSYSDDKYVTLGFGLGYVDFARSRGVFGEPGFAFRLTAGHHFNRYLEAQAYYGFSTFRLKSPDSFDPTASLDTRAGMNQGVLRMIVSWPDWFVQPYLSAGFGGYSLFGVNQETELSFPADWMFPVSGGMRTYVFKNLISLDVDFTYDFLMGVNQSTYTLERLKIPSVRFDTYSVMATVVIHFL